MNRFIFAFVAVLCFVFTPSFAPAAQQQPRTQQAAQPQQRRLTPQEAFALVAGEAEKGNAGAMVRLGNFYEQGTGVGRNFIKAREWYEKAAKAGSPEGMYNLGVCYEIGIGTSGDMKEAVRRFTEASDKGFGVASYKLAGMYMAGGGIGQDNAKAASFLTRAADNGFAPAANDLGVAYLRGDIGLPKDAGKAHDMFARAAALGSVDAMKNLAVLYKDGIGRSASTQKAAVWYTIAKKAGYPKGIVDPVIAELTKKLSAGDRKKVEQEAAAWFTQHFPQATAAQ